MSTSLHTLNIRLLSILTSRARGPIEEGLQEFQAANLEAVLDAEWQSVQESADAEAESKRRCYEYECNARLARWGQELAEAQAEAIVDNARRDCNETWLRYIKASNADYDAYVVSERTPEAEAAYNEYIGCMDDLSHAIRDAQW